MLDYKKGKREEKRSTHQGDRLWRNLNTLILYTTDMLIIWREPQPGIKSANMKKSFMLYDLILNFSLKTEALYLSKKAF